VSPDAPHPERARYEPAEEKSIVAEFAQAGGAHCPRCSVAMTARPIGGGSFGLGYSRKREWLLCPSCKRSVMFDVKRGTRN
jgi:hypothetical protein